MRSIHNVLYKLIAFLIRLFCPIKYWYSVVHKVTQFTKYLFINSTNKFHAIERRRADQINKLLSLLTRSQREFPIPYTFESFELPKSTQGIILCSVHLPLVKVAVKSCLEHEILIDYALVGRATKDSKMAVWGMKTKLPTLVRNSYVLVKAKTRLQQNKTILLMIDQKDGQYSPNMLKLCQKLNSQLYFLFSELSAHGEIITRYLPAPYPNCNTQQEIEANLNYLRKESDEIFRRYG